MKKTPVQFDSSFETSLENDVSVKIKSSVTEEFRSIKRSLLAFAFDKNESKTVKNRVMVTSLSGGEGSTFSAFWLAKSIANELDKTVLLVDADVTSARLSASMTPKQDVGLIDYLSEKDIDASSVIYHTNSDSLKVLPIGKKHDFANELLSSERMNDLMQEFNGRYSDRLVIFDAPPLLSTNEAMALARQVDQIVVVVEESVTRVIELQVVNAELSRLNIPIHYILNKTLHKPKWQL